MMYLPIYMDLNQKTSNYPCFKIIGLFALPHRTKEEMHILNHAKQEVHDDDYAPNGG